VKRYKPFDLMVERADQGYRARALDSPAGEGDAGLPLSLAADMERLAAALEAAPRPRRGDAGTAERRLAEELGGKLFRTVFSGEVGRRFAASVHEAAIHREGLRLRLHLGSVPELSRWPWEYLYDPARKVFFAISGETPVVRYLSLPEHAPPLKLELPLSVLVVAPASIDASRLQAEQEIQRIERELAPLKRRGKVVLDELRPPTLSALDERLRGRPVHILHFIGHGKYDAEHGEGVLLFDDEHGRPSQVTGQRLAAVLFGRDVRLVVLNACEGARHDEKDAFSGVAQTLLQGRVPAVVAMQRSISNRAAMTFAQRFYGALAEGTPVDAAVAEARLAMVAQSQSLEWGAPVLYLRSREAELFDLGPVSTGRRRPPASAALIAALVLAGVVAFLARDRRPGAVLFFPSGSPRCPSPKSTEILFSWIPRGSFEMGSERGDLNERPAHPVTITKPFCMAAYETTVGQWNEVMGGGVPTVRDDWLKPKVDVSWFEAHEFLRRLNAQNPGRRFFLPREAQWEYAARAGSALSYGFSDRPDELYTHANCLSKGEHSDGYDGAAPVGMFEANAWRLSDMQGNVWEWVEDRYGGYDAAPVVDPEGPVVGDKRVRRGGSFKNKPEHCRPSTREPSYPDQRLDNLGFRIAAEPVS
jgi:formylglycine-generating enzyme required for sulfatase activity